MQNLLQIISLYLPRAVARKSEVELRKGKWQDRAILLVDISGFTPLTEKLTALGKEGAEEITGIVNSYFTPLLDIMGKYGGDLLTFSGDALIVIFSGKDKELRAGQVAWEMQEFMKKFAKVKTSQGVFPLSLHIGIHTGKVLETVVGTKKLGLCYAILGKVANKVALIGEKSKAKEILISEAVLKKIKEKVQVEDKEKGIYGLIELKEKLKPGKTKAKAHVYKEKKKIIEKLESIVPHLLPGLLDKIKAHPESKEIWGEHRRVTSLFLNFWGMDYESDKKAVKKLQTYFSQIQQSVHKYGGTIDKIDFSPLGDRILILFGVPYAHEDDEERAVRCATEIMAMSPEDFSQRIGINSGFIFAGNVGSEIRRKYTVMGDEINLAARLMSIAKKEMLISEAVANKAKEKFEIEPLRLVKVKGKTKLVKLYRLVGLKVEERELFKIRMGESKIMVGRDKERNTMKKVIEKVKLSKGQMVSITGEAGIGKSRLARELTDEWGKQGFKFYGGDCQSYGKSISYLLWIDLVSSYMGIFKFDSKKDKCAKIEKFMKEVDTKLKEWTPIIGELLGVKIPETSLTKSLDAKLRRQRLFDIVLQFIRWHAEKEPVMLVLEDLHWADTGSIELLNYVARNIGDYAILLCLVYRPIKEKMEFMEKPYYTAFTLKELSDKDNIDLAKLLLNTEGLPAQLRNLVLTKTQGNPFFTEEVIKSLMEQGALKLEAENWKLVTEKLELPDTIQGVIMSRIDRLDEETKHVLQVASVIGREFEYRLLDGIYPSKIDLKNELSILEELDLILLERREGQERYFFKHIMTQEVAYDSLAFKRRRSFHNTLGDFLEKLYKESLEEQYGFLAHHYYQGHNWEKSFYYSIEAGNKSKKAYANQEALNYYDRALEVFDKLCKEGYHKKFLKRIQKELEKEK
ncbi:AAA family ATPase [candidate division WOR-3 bacterium]|nr:AAA family ATPase [candidate division WOR-3 bacterium]